MSGQKQQKTGRGVERSKGLDDRKQGRGEVDY